MSAPERFWAYRAGAPAPGYPWPPRGYLVPVEVVRASDYDAVLGSLEAARSVARHWAKRTRVELDNAEAFEERMRAAEAALAEAKVTIEAYRIHAHQTDGIIRIVTAPSDADLEALADAVMIIETPSAMDVARNVLQVIADRARAPEREGDEK